MKGKLPIQAAKNVAEQYNLDQVILIARSHKDNLTHFVTYGKSDQDCGMAAIDGRKLRAVVEACPTSFEDALEAAKFIRPKDINDG